MNLPNSIVSNLLIKQVPFMLFALAGIFYGKEEINLLAGLRFTYGLGLTASVYALQNYIFLSAVQIQNKHKFILSLSLLIASFFLLDKFNLNILISGIILLQLSYTAGFQITYLKISRNFKSLLKFSICGLLASIVVFLVMFLFSLDMLFNYTLSLASFFIIFLFIKPEASNVLINGLNISEFLLAIFPSIFSPLVLFLVFELELSSADFGLARLSMLSFGVGMAGLIFEGIFEENFISGNPTYKNLVNYLKLIFIIAILTYGMVYGASLLVIKESLCNIRDLSIFIVWSGMSINLTFLGKLILSHRKVEINIVFNAIYFLVFISLINLVDASGYSVIYIILISQFVVMLLQYSYARRQNIVSRGFFNRQ